MSNKRKFLKVFLCLFLGASSMFGGTMDPKQIEEHLRIMNETRIEVVIPADIGRGKGDPEVA